MTEGMKSKLVKHAKQSAIGGTISSFPDEYETEGISWDEAYDTFMKSDNETFTSEFVFYEGVDHWNYLDLENQKMLLQAEFEKIMRNILETYEIVTGQELSYEEKRSLLWN